MPTTREIEDALREQEANRAAAEDRTEELLLMLLAWHVANEESGGGDDEAPILLKATRSAEKVVSASTRAALTVLMLLPGERATAPNDPDMIAKTERFATLDKKMVESILSEANGIARAAAKSPSKNLATGKDRRAWVKELSKSVGTTFSNKIAEQILPMLEDALGVVLGKVWISRGDQRVRKLHRMLHGTLVEKDAPFWTQDETGLTLDFPGDTTAPPETWHGCRCSMFLSPMSDAVSKPVLDVIRSKGQLAPSQTSTMTASGFNEEDIRILRGV